MQSRSGRTGKRSNSKMKTVKGLFFYLLLGFIVVQVVGMLAINVTLGETTTKDFNSVVDTEIIPSFESSVYGRVEEEVKIGMTQEEIYSILRRATNVGEAYKEYGIKDTVESSIRTNGLKLESDKIFNKVLMSVDYTISRKTGSKVSEENQFNRTIKRAYILVFEEGKLVELEASEL